MSDQEAALAELLTSVRSCIVCASDLPSGPRPIVQVGRSAGVVIIGQAPGRRVHDSGVPWDDPSGDTLRAWLGVTRAQFYDTDSLALVPMGFCYPGSSPSGDLPPRRECAPLWHDRLLGHLPTQRLTIIIGAHAHRRYTSDAGRTLTDAVGRWAELLPDRVVLPHPSPRNRNWLVRHPWFESETIPALQRRVEEAMNR